MKSHVIISIIIAICTCSALLYTYHSIYAVRGGGRGGGHHSGRGGRHQHQHRDGRQHHIRHGGHLARYRGEWQRGWRRPWNHGRVGIYPYHRRAYPLSIYTYDREYDYSYDDYPVTYYDTPYQDYQDSQGKNYWSVSNNTPYDIEIYPEGHIIKTVRADSQNVPIPHEHNFNFTITAPNGKRIRSSTTDHYITIEEHSNGNIALSTQP